MNYNKSYRNCWLRAITNQRARVILLLICATFIFTPSVRWLLHAEVRQAGETNGLATGNSTSELFISRIRNRQVNLSTSMPKFKSNASIQVDERFAKVRNSRSTEIVLKMSETPAVWNIEGSNINATKNGSSKSESTRNHLLENDLVNGVEEGQLPREECVMMEVETQGFWNLLDALIYSALPAFFLVLLDAIIVRRLRRARDTNLEETECMRPQGRTAGVSFDTCHRQKLQQLPGGSRTLMREENRDLRGARDSDHLLVLPESYRRRLNCSEFNIASAGSTQQLNTYQGASVLFPGARKSAQTTPGSPIGASRNPSALGRAPGRDLHLTLVLLVPSLAFLVLTFPIAAGHALQMSIGERRMFEVVQPNALMIMFAIAELLAYAQHALNFYLCVLTSGSFRRATWRRATRSRLYRWLVVGFRRIRSGGGFFGRTCCVRRRARNAPPLIRFQWFPANPQIPPNFRGGADNIQFDRILQCSTLTSARRPNVPRGEHFHYNAREQLLSSFATPFSCVRPPNSGPAAAAEEAGAVGLLVRHPAPSPNTNQQPSQFLFICICNHSSSSSASSHVCRNGGVALSSSSRTLYEHKLLPSGGSNACSALSESSPRSELWKNRNHDATV